jgi:hypothetical protein
MLPQPAAAGDAAPEPRPGGLIVKSIFMTHVRRIGWLRTALGGGLMYVSVLEFVFLHLTTIVVLYRWLFRPAFQSRAFDHRDYLLMDRGRIQGMRRFDRLNCEFCGYANGTARLWIDVVDAIAAARPAPGRRLQRWATGAYGLCLAVFLLFNFVFSKLLFGVIALFLGLHWAGNEETWRRIVAEDYAGQYGPVWRTLVRLARLYAETLQVNLEQIESSWCPLKHVTTATSVSPDHHRNFFERDQLPQMFAALEAEGTVSPRKPRY